MEGYKYISKYNKLLNSYSKVRLFVSMAEIRIFEEKAIQSYQKNKIGGFCHTYIGQEAVATGILSALNTNDHVITGYRDHAHALILNTDPTFLMSELYGKRIGCSTGKGGSMHFFNTERKFWGGHGIVAAQTPLGAGIAFALRYQSTPLNTPCVCVCFMGEGSVNQGVFYESLNLSILWKLPVLYIIENNRYSMGTKREDSFVGSYISKKFKGFDVSWGVIKKGFCVYTVRDYINKVSNKVRKYNIPSVLEIYTYRYKGHSMSDPDTTYRLKDEISSYKASRDPITKFENILLSEGLINTKLIGKALNSIRSKINWCTARSDTAKYPSKRSLFNQIYWDIDHLYFKKTKGVYFF